MTLPGPNWPPLQADTQLRQKRPVIVENITKAAMAGEREYVIECDDLCPDAKMKLCTELCKLFGFVFASNSRGEWDRMDVFNISHSPVSKSYRVLFR